MSKEVMIKAAINRKRSGDVKAKQVKFLGHVVRKEALKNLVMERRVKRKEAKEKKDDRVVRLNGRNIKHREVEVLHKTKNRELGMEMIAYHFLHPGRGHLKNRKASI